jgi:hypothetical protein
VLKNVLNRRPISSRRGFENSHVKFIINHTSGGSLDSYIFAWQSNNVERISAR